MEGKTNEQQQLIPERTALLDFFFLPCFSVASVVQFLGIKDSVKLEATNLEEERGTTENTERRIEV